MARHGAQTLTYAEYLAAEEVAEIRHEYLNGEVWAMPGSTIEHAGLAAAIGAQLSQVLLGRPCRVFSSNVRVRIVDTGLLDAAIKRALTNLAAPTGSRR